MCYAHPPEPYKCNVCGENIESGCALPPKQEGDPQPVSLSIIPMYHIFGLAYNVMQPLTIGAKMVSLPKFVRSEGMN